MCLGKCKGLCKSKRPECKNKQEENKIENSKDPVDNLDIEEIISDEEFTGEEKYDTEEI